MGFKSEDKILEAELKAKKGSENYFCPSCQEKMKKKRLPKVGNNNLKAISFKQK